MDLEMRKINFSFGTNKILEDVDFTLKGGEICALLGENGAGKSTLMNLLGGVYQPDQGSILLDGKEISFASPVESLDAGIGFIHQELNLISDLTVYENMYLTHLQKKGVLLDAKGMKQQVADFFKEMDLDIDPSAMVRDLDVSYKQIVEISRALLQQASIIIMDEPTTSLSEPEIERVFDMMRKLKSRGVSIIFISHKLGEVMEICDRYTVLRNGNAVAFGNVADTTTEQLAAHMVGHQVITGIRSRTHELGREILRLEHLTNNKDFHDISLTVHEGEILGVTGLLGDGRSELFQSVFGADGGKYEGKIFLRNEQDEMEEIHPSTTHQALTSGIAYVPRNRKENAILKDLTILDNGTIVGLPHFKKHGLLDTKMQHTKFADQVKKLLIKVQDEMEPITSLSGGNQQKVVLAKWLMEHPKLLILDNPTQGVDVGAKEEIYDIIAQLAKEGTAIVVLSSEAQEIIRLCERSLVLYHGRISGEVSGEDMTEYKIMLLATTAGEQ